MSVMITSRASSLRHLRPVQPLDFPASREEWELGQSLRHLHLCELLHQILLAAVTPQDSVGADQFVYFDAGDPGRCLAPDGFVKRGHSQDFFSSWKVWERGTPELCVEILSPSDTREPLTLEKKLALYRALGTLEVVCFDADEGRVRAWDRIEGDLVERDVPAGGGTPCLTLDAEWVIAPGGVVGAALRLAREGALVLTPEERAVAGEQAERAAKEQERAAKEQERAAKEEALAEVARLRALLDDRG